MIFLHIWIKNLLAVKFHTVSFFPLGDTYDYHQTNQCAKKVGFPKYRESKCTHIQVSSIALSIDRFHCMCVHVDVLTTHDMSVNNNNNNC